MLIPVLPESVRYAARYKKGMLGKEEVHDLICAGREDEAMYALMSAFHSKPRAQREILEGLAACIRQHPFIPARAWIEALILHSFPRGRLIPARPLVAMSWHGFIPRDAYRACALMSAAEGRTPILVGYPTTAGLISFLQEGATFGIILPERLHWQRWGFLFPARVMAYDYQASYLRPEHLRHRPITLLYVPYDGALDDITSVCDALWRCGTDIDVRVTSVLEVLRDTTAA